VNWRVSLICLALQLAPLHREEATDLLTDQLGAIRDETMKQVQACSAGSTLRTVSEYLDRKQGQVLL
jgi:hypothetical protein